MSGINPFDNKYLLNDRGKNGSPSRKRSDRDENAAIAGKINELYRSFMQSYVRRINDSTFKVTIGGIRIGSAKYSRLAQINLKSRIITFSRYAIENVPERGRRYLVLHELAHVLEASHNKHFWNLVEAHEPQYKEIGLALDRAFKKNVQSHERNERQGFNPSLNEAVRALNLNEAKDLLWTPDHGFIDRNNKILGLQQDQLKLFTGETSGQLEEGFNEYLDLRENYEDEPGIIVGGSQDNELRQWERFMEGGQGDYQEDEPLNFAPGMAAESQSQCIGSDMDADFDGYYENYIYNEYENNGIFGTISGGAD